MDYLSSILNHKPIIYVTRDLERALGLPLDTPNHFIISNYSDFAKLVLNKAEGGAKGRKNVLLIKNKKMLDTRELLLRPETKNFVNARKVANILVFKNTALIEKICRQNGWILLNPSASLSNTVEEKISQIAWLGPLKKYLPQYQILKCKNIVWPSKPCQPRQLCQPFILQFNRSHTGSGTILIENEKQLKEIQQKFPEREARIAEYISGPLFTNNNVVTNDGVLIGNISYQITGLKPFTDLPFSTIGNDWALPYKILTKKQIARYKKIATDVGQRLKKAGWKGLFGIDVVMHEKTGKLYLVEINCRQPASTTYESQLQSQTKTYNLKPKTYLTTFEAQLMALSGINLKRKKLIKIKDGAQMILRNKEKGIGNKGRIVNKLKKDFNVIEYNNTEHNNDLLRIQSQTGIMKKHNKFNKIGEKIVKIIR